MNRNELEDIIKMSNSIGQVRKILGLPSNGQSRNKVLLLIEEYKIDISHFDNGKNKRKYERIERNCPVCNNSFIIKKGSRSGKKITCSHSCSNSYFRIKAGNGNFDNLKNYKKICFKYHKRKCVCCNENKVLDVHHFDENRDNNEPINLIPLCPTHHRYVHSKYKNEVINIIEKYINDWIKKRVVTKV